jgi:hypothetical protein
MKMREAFKFDLRPIGAQDPELARIVRFVTEIGSAVRLCGPNHGARRSRASHTSIT